jgi:5'(3')-deoxyribonucleotidase
MMRIIMDVDGVAADFVGHLLKHVDNPITQDEITDFDLFKFLPSKKVAYAHEVLQDKKFWQTLPVLPGAKEFVAEATRRGCAVFWATSPWLPCVGWEAYRREWLARHFKAHAKTVLIGESKHIIAGDVFIDDKYANVRDWAAYNPNGKAFLVDRPWNAKYDWPRRVRLADLMRRFEK